MIERQDIKTAIDMVDQIEPNGYGDHIVSVLMQCGNEIAELRAEVERLKRCNGDIHKIRAECRKKLAESQAREKQLREALQTYIDEHEECSDADDWTAMLCSLEAHHVADEAIALPNDDTALRELLKAERERCAKVCEKEATDPHNVPAAIVARRCAESIRNMGDSND